jgi:hypothetical protein
LKNKQKFIIGGILLVLIVFIFSLKSKFQKENENFDTFNVNFHSDSIFQMSRINFPIRGQLIDGFENHDWNAKNWQFITTEVGSKNLPKEFREKVIKTDSLVIENIWIENSGFKLERQFKKMNSQWFLTYYNEVNL